MTIIKIDYKIALDYQLGEVFDHDTSPWVNMSDIGRYIVYDETGSSFAIVDTIDLGEAELEFYDWYYLNGADPFRIPYFTTYEQLDYIKDRLPKNTVVRLQTYNKELIYLQKCNNRYIVLSDSSLVVYQKLHHIIGDDNG